jgi:hypothetical protein
MMKADLNPHHTPGATVTPNKGGWRLSLPGGPPGEYRLAQLDDYGSLARRRFPWQEPLSLSLRARASSGSLPGTWGFGLWNDPFGLSLGFGGNRLRLPALPNAAWFFHASPENWLSFGDQPGNGFLVQNLRSPARPLGRLARVAAALPFSPVKARARMSQIVEEAGVSLSVDPTEWHAYRLEWGTQRVRFWVDEAQVLEASFSPPPPLGLVLWIDNQYAAFTPEGRLGWGTLANPACWLELENIELNN